MSSRLRRIGEFVVVSLSFALMAATSASAALPGGYAPTSTDNPATATAGDRFGENLVNAGDVNRDGKDDVMVGVPKAKAPGALATLTGKVVFVDGAGGGIIRTVEVPSSQVSRHGANTDFGARVATLGDINGDGVPEHVVSAPGTDLSDASPDTGAVYVLDGASFSIIKRIQLAADDLPPGAPGFGAGLAAASGNPACAGHGGIGDCPYGDGTAVAIGDLDGGGEPDVLVGAPDYAETADSDPDGCDAPGIQTCPGLGRIYIYSGESISGSVVAPLDSPASVIKWFDKTSASQQPRLGAAIAPLGDVGKCDVPVGFFGASCLPGTPNTARSNIPDGVPDFVAAAPGLDAGASTDAGGGLVFDGKIGLAVSRTDQPDAQANAGFGLGSNAPAPGDLAFSPVPDALLSAPSLDLAVADQGRAYVADGDLAASTAPLNFNDPVPADGAKFGAAAVSLGNVAGDAPGEIAIGRGDGSTGSVQIFSACTGGLLQTINDQEPGSSFGTALAPLGDLNADGYLDIAVGAPGHDSAKGRVYIMKSDGSPGPAFAGCNPDTGGGGGGGGGGVTGGGSGGTGTGGGGATSPPPGGKQVSSLAQRRIKFSSNKKRVKVSAPVKLLGRITSKKNQRSCAAKQKVSIQRLEANGWPTVDVAVTGKGGRFGVVLNPAPAQTFTYRARVRQNKRCTAAISKYVKVKVTE